MGQKLSRKNPGKTANTREETSKLKYNTASSQQISNEKPLLSLDYQDFPKPPSSEDLNDLNDISVHNDDINISIKSDSKENKDGLLSLKKSSSLTFRRCSYRKKRSKSFLNQCVEELPLKKTESYKSAVQTKQLSSTTPIEPGNGDPVKDQWVQKESLVYSTHVEKPKPTKYWVHTELQYVIMLPATKRKYHTARPSVKVTEPSKNDFDQHNEEPGPKESSSSSSSSESQSFIPRSQAKMPTKPKGKFCCAKRQDSG